MKITESMFNTGDIVALKIWTRADIARCLKEYGITPTQYNIDAVVCNNSIYRLSYCLDEEWNIINGIIEELIAHGEVR